MYYEHQLTTFAFARGLTVRMAFVPALQTCCSVRANLLMTARDNAHVPSRPLGLVQSPRCGAIHGQREQWGRDTPHRPELEVRIRRALFGSDKVRRRRTCRRTATARCGSHGNPTLARRPFTEAEQRYGSRSLCAGLASPAQRPRQRALALLCSWRPGREASAAATLVCTDARRLGFALHGGDGVGRARLRGRWEQRRRAVYGPAALFELAHTGSLIVHSGRSLLCARLVSEGTVLYGDTWT
ncbi:hypothetical protein FKP32DRAFT_579248 [Trametes sanguinea]|nr:hypothetical protein FKP32DRAFT_579248 [Trametes sanguinea]